MRKAIQKYINKWKSIGYDEIPEEIPVRIEQLELAPSYKSIAIKILNNDFHLPQSKSSVYYELKKIELTDKGKIKKTNQLKLNL